MDLKGLQKELKEMQGIIVDNRLKLYKEMVYGPDSKLEILLEGTYKGYQFYILNLGTHPTAYVEIPRESKLFGKGYNKIYEMEIDIDVHGGLTYASDKLHSIKENTWFIGWDYAHAGDYAGYEEILPSKIRTGGYKWTTKEIFDDVVSVIEQIIKEENK